MDKRDTYRIYHKALRDGILVRPMRCQECRVKAYRALDGRPRIHGHHTDYSNPLDVVWLCTRCHRKVHADMPRPINQEVTQAVKHYRTIEKELKRFGQKPNLSACARQWKIAKSSLWYALNKAKP